MDLLTPIWSIGDIYIRALTATVVPLTVSSIALSILSIENKNKLKAIAKCTFGFYAISGTMACLTGIVANHWLHFSIPVSSLATASTKSAIPEFSEIIPSFIPNNIVAALASNNLVQVILLTLTIAVAARRLPEKELTLLHTSLSAVKLISLQVLQWVLKFTPFAAFLLFAKMAYQTDISIFYQLGKFFLTVTAAASFHAVITLPMIAAFWGNFNAYRYFTHVKKALLLALTTASSLAALPVAMEQSEKNGRVDPRVTGFTLPLGATLNWDGSGLYQALVALFLAQLSGIELTFAKELTVFFLVMLSSAGTAGIPGGGIVLLSMVLTILGVPSEYLSIYILVDRFWDYPITALNVWGDLIAVQTVQRRLVKANQLSPLTIG